MLDNDIQTLRLSCKYLQVATLAELVSQHAVVTHYAVVALQEEEQEKRQQQPSYELLRMSGDHLMITANWWRIAFVSLFATIFA